uniref:Uncharacterized protein n=1 Tax=Sus scrofa TaxID=9823 RepID=A0A4X1T4C9_PIG
MQEWHRACLANHGENHALTEACRQLGAGLGSPHAPGRPRGSKQGRKGHRQLRSAWEASRVCANVAGPRVSSRGHRTQGCFSLLAATTGIRSPTVEPPHVQFPKRREKKHLLPSTHGTCVAKLRNHRGGGQGAPQPAAGLRPGRHPGHWAGSCQKFPRGGSCRHGRARARCGVAGTRGKGPCRDLPRQASGFLCGCRNQDCVVSAEGQTHRSPARVEDPEMTRTSETC